MAVESDDPAQKGPVRTQLELAVSAIAVASAAFYVIGYLSFRQRLTTLGVASDASVLDERYLFAAARFLHYFILTVANTAAAAMTAPGLVAVVVVVAILRWLAHRGPQRVATIVSALRAFDLMLRRRQAYAIAGVAVSLLAIERFQDVLNLTHILIEPPSPHVRDAMCALLASDSGGRVELFEFLERLGVFALTGAIWWAVRQSPHTSRWVTKVLAALVVIQGLMLPMAHGVLTSVQNTPIVEWQDEPGQLWLVADGNEYFTFFRESPARLLSVRRKSVPILGVVAYGNPLQATCTAFSAPAQQNR